MKKVILTVAFAFGLIAPASAIDESGSTPLGFVNIHNNDCSPWGENHVEVNIWDPDQPGPVTEPNQCTRVVVRLKHGESKTISLAGRVEGTVPDGGAHYSHNCVYKHEAKGTVGGKRDIYADAQSSITCKNDWFGVCQCTKD